MDLHLQKGFQNRCMPAGVPTRPTELAFFTVSVNVILLILNVPGNLLLILAVVKNPYKNLRNPFNYLMTNLAVADLLMAIVVYPLSISFHIKEGLHQKPATEETEVFHVLFFISSTASVLSLASLAVERYLAICNPHSYRNKFTGKRILATVAGIWVLAVSLSLVYLKVGFITCAFILANTAVAAGVIITCFTYSWMIYKFKRHIRTYEDVTASSDAAHIQGVTSVGHTPALHDRAVTWQRKITNMFLVVVVALLCCYVPATAFIYAISLCETCPCDTLHWFMDLLCIFMMMNSNVNFFCYGLRSRRFRRAFLRILRIKR